ncbi:hypothetical protein PHET_00234 [Paragonimus heterotremus]|uniref:Uncharacterized protein n=1 Tax=Paragonimus heterotremus TaxID=100268 RepID=A0A8J4TJU6_9TREM|nr:hypothetical protein PHET_00234 [Paragonimus heterotremus]
MKTLPTYGIVGILLKRMLNNNWHMCDCQPFLLVISTEHLSRSPNVIICVDGPKTVTILGPEETTGLLHTSAQLHLATFKLKSSARKIYNESNSLRHVYPDRPQYLLCLTSPFFDRTTVKWYGLLNITGQWQELTALDTFTRQLEDDGINYVLGSIVQLVSTNTDHAPLQWISVKCVVEPSQQELSDENESVRMHQIELRNYG